MGTIMIFLRDIILSELNFFPNDIESIFVELNFRKWKWLLCETYQPSSQSDEYFFNKLDKTLDTYSKNDQVFFKGEFNTEVLE